VKILTSPECEEWLASRYGSSELDDALAQRFRDPRVFQLPAGVHRRTAVAHALVEALDPTAPGLLWITAWGIFPGAENLALFDGYRRSLGENRPLHEAPGHVFDGASIEEIECILDLSLYFFWDATLLAEGTAARISHDEWIELRADDLQLRQLERLFDAT
jgi:hypothetical protein